jgi:hypothetical protein
MKIIHLITGISILIVSSVYSAENSIPFIKPKEYAELHNQVSNSNNLNWAKSMELLAKTGDAFTLEHLKTADMKMSGMQLTDPCRDYVLKVTQSAIEDTIKKEDPKVFTKRIEMCLERAAWADLNGNPLKVSLVPWTLKILHEHLEAPGVKAELQRIQSYYEPKDEKSAPDISMRDRVRDYTIQILKM